MAKVTAGRLTLANIDDADTKLDAITPLGLSVHSASNGTDVEVCFSYLDGLGIEYFVLEVWDEATGQWVAYDGTDGVIAV